MTSQPPDRPTVVLLHGLGRTQRSMAGLRRFLRKLGYPTWSCTYPSRRLAVADLGRWLSDRIQNDLGDEAELKAVTHSLGGILIRHMGHLPWRGVVMLAPPNRGSHVAASLQRLRLYRSLYGPVAGELADPASWPDPPRPFAVIAGTRGASVGNPPSWLIRKMGLLPRDARHDGTVLVAETRLDGMAGFAEVDASHTFVMDHPEARTLIARFLERGHF